MAYNLSMQMNLQAPSAGEISSVKKTIESGLSGIKVSTLDAASFSKANKQINDTRQHLERGQKAANSFLTELEGKGRSFVAYTVASTAVLKLVASIRNATMGAIEYDAELIRIAQTTGDTVDAIYKHSASLIEISKNYNISATKVAQFTKILAQTGLSFRDAAKGAEILARTTLLASFDNISETTEGLISLMNTFKLSVSQAGIVLEEINAVSKKYAVESSDIVDAIRRSGGAFKSAGGNITELIGLFTSVRATSRESAETIATAFNTIFGRLQRPETIEYFKQLGIALETVEGNFVGPNEAIKRISEGLARLGINAGSVQFAAIAEKIGGLRQLSKVIPLINQYSLAQDAMRTANASGVSSLEDMEKAQKGIGYQLGALQKDFQALIQEVVSSDSFKFAVDVFISMSKALLEITRALKPLLPLLAAFVTFKIGKGLTSFLSGGGGGPNLKGIKNAASAVGMARGGVVPGTGNRDTVPAMLTPGEFVIRKKSVSKIGAGNLHAMNASRYADGGVVGEDSIAKRIENETGTKISKTVAQKLAKNALLIDPYIAKIKSGQIKKGSASTNVREFGAVFLEKKTQPKGDVREAVVNGKEVKYRVNSAFLDQTDAEVIKNGIVREQASNAINAVANHIGRSFGMDSFTTDQGVPNLAAITGSVFEGALSKLSKETPLDTDDQRIFDFPSGLSSADKIFGADAAKLKGIPTDAKYSSSSSALDSIRGKVVNYLTKRKGYAKGGAATDTVPALLTPGEFVINKKAAANIGHANLNRMNKRGVVGFAKGGIVGGLQRFENGGIADDIKRGTGDVIKDLSHIKKVFLQVVSGIGKAGTVLSKTIKFQDTSPNANGNITNGTFFSLLNKIAVQKGRGTESTVMHETGHAVDFQAGGGQAFASDQAGTFQNELAKAARPKIEAALKELNVPEGYLKYRLKLKELFADFFQKSEPEVRAIIANTTDAAKGMKELGKLMGEQPDKFKRLYGDVHENLQIQAAATAAAAAKASSVPTEPISKVSKLTGKRARKAAGHSIEGLKSGTPGGGIKEGLANLAKTEASIKQQTAAAAARSNLSVGTKQSKAPSLLQGIFGTQAAASALKTFGGANINQDILGKAEGRAGVFGAAGDFAGKFQRKGAVGAAGKAIGKVPGLGGVGQLIYKNAGLIAKGAGILAKGLNVAGWVDLLGGFADSLITPDFGKAKDAAIARGDADSAAASAAREYAQSQLRSIPIIGGVLSSLRSLGEKVGLFSAATEKDLDARGKLIVGNARLSASLNGLDKKLQTANQSLDNAFAVGDDAAAQKAFAQGGAAITDIQSQINAQNANAANTADGKVGTAALDAGKAALAGAAAGALVAGPIGAAVGAIGAGAYAFYSSFTASTESVVKAHELNAEAYTKMGEAISQRISQVGGLLTNETSRVIAAGGTAEQAFQNIRNKLGGVEFDKLFGKIDPKNLGQSLKDLNVESEASAKAVAATSKALGDAEIAGNKTTISIAKEAAAKAQADQLRTETTRKEVAAMLAAQIQQDALNKERQIEARAIAEQIKTMRAWTQHMDKVNDKFRELEGVADDMSKIGTGEQTFDQARGGLGIGVSRKTLQKSTDEIFRDDKAFNEIRNSIAGPARGQLDKAKQGFGAIEKLESVLADSSSAGAKEIAKLVQEGKGATEDKRTTLETDILDKLVGLSGQRQKELVNGRATTGIATLDAALLEYAKSLTSSGGLQNIAGASEDAKKKLTSQVQEFVEAHKETITKLVAAQQQYRQSQLQLIQKQIDFANKVYDTEKSYAEETIALREDTARFLSKGQDQGRSRKTEFTIRGGAINERNQAAASRRAGLGQNLRQLDATGVDNPLLTGNISADVNTLVTSLQNLNGTSDQTSVALQGAANSYITAIRDQIGIENDRLTLLKDQAEAQRDYTQALRDAQGDLVTEFAFGTDQQRGDLLNTSAAANFAAQQGSLAGIPEEMRSQVGSFLDRFSDVALPGAGGRTGAQIKGQIAAREAVRAGIISKSQEADFAAKAAKKEIPISQQFSEGIKEQTAKIKALVDEEKRLKDIVNAKELQNIDKFATSVVDFGTKVKEINAELNKAKGEGSVVAGATTPAASQETNKKKLSTEELLDRASAIGAGDRLKEIDTKDRAKLEAGRGAVEEAQKKLAEHRKTGGNRSKAGIENLTPAQLETRNALIADEQTKREAFNTETAKFNERLAIAKANADKEKKYQDEAKQEAAAKTATQEAAGAPSSDPADVAKQEAAKAGTGPLTAPLPVKTGPLFEEDHESLATQVQAQKAAEEAEKKAQNQRKLAAMLEKNRQNREALGYLPGSSLGGQSFQASEKEQLDMAKRLTREPTKPIGNVGRNTGAASPGGVQAPKLEVMGQQDITVRLPDIQALVNTAITSLVYETIGSTFAKLSEDVRSVNNFDELASTFANGNGITDTTTKSMEGMV